MKEVTHQIAFLFPDYISTPDPVTFPAAAYWEEPEVLVDSF